MTDYQNSKIAKEIGVLVKNYNSTINILDGLLFRQRDMIRSIEYYTNSKYLGGMKDDLGRDKPFYNIVNAMCDTENAAKDLDTADIQIASDDGNHYTEAFLLSKEVYEWMKDENFAKTLNKMRDVHTRYGSLLVKKYMKTDADGNKELCLEVPEWKNLITDQVDILESPIIECHYMSRSKMMQKTGWQNVEEAIKKASTGGYTTRIPVYEVRGEFPLSFFKEINGEDTTPDDDKTFSYQLYYFGGQYGQPTTLGQENNNSLFDLGSLTPLYWENDTEKCYKYLARKRRAGRSFGVGVVEEGEEAQVWTNDAVLKQFRAMEYTTKVIGQTASKQLKGRNMLNEVDDGQILQHEDGKPITSLALLPAGGLTQYSALITQWFQQYERATSSYGALRGEAPSSRTAFRLQSAMLNQASAVVRTIQEEFGIFLTEMFEEWILPFLAKKLNTAHILSHEFSAAELKTIDKNFSTHAANDTAISLMLSGRALTEEDYAALFNQADQHIKQTKATRFLDLPKNYYKDVLKNLTVIITGEQRQAKKDSLDALMMLLKVYQGSPDLINDPVLTQIFMQIVDISGSGISPALITTAIQERAQQQAQQQGKPAGKVNQSINFKDLPPDGQQQMAAEVGIQLQSTQQGGAPAQQQPGPGMPAQQ